MIDLYPLLVSAADRGALPRVVAYNRIDGPGSSLDLPDLQQAFWTLPAFSADWLRDPALAWSKDLPRTVGMTIDTGTVIEARPLKPGLIGVQSVEYGTETAGARGGIIPVKANWLLKVLDIFGLDGVKLVLHNLKSGTHSAGLGGSATATAGVCILANELAGRPLSPVQLVSMASRMEHTYGVSLTGTQEQSNVVFGGVTDYIWFPWGLPASPDSGFGASLRTTLAPPESYPELESRLAIFHSGVTRPSANVNAVWLAALRTTPGYVAHRSLLDVAYHFREALRVNDWQGVAEAMTRYQETRTQLCPEYMVGAHEIHGFASARQASCFPLGAGGGGGILVFSPEPDQLLRLRRELRDVYREIPFQLRSSGHELVNLPLVEG